VTQLLANYLSANYSTTTTTQTGFEP
jgi:hypothetical protein